MRPDLETYYLIDQYLDNNLKGEELIAFENQLSQDADFTKAVAEQRILNDLILEAELKDVRAQIGKDLINIQKPSFFRMNWQWIGLSILSICGILFFGLNSNTDTVTQPSSVQPSEHTEKSVAPKTTTTQENTSTSTAVITVKNHASVETSTIEETGTNNLAVIDSVHTSPKEGTPAVDSTPANHTPATVTATAAEETKKTDCSVAKILFSLTTEASCENTETGSIAIEKLSGGTAPYSFSLNNKKVKEKIISDLGAGTYEIKITDRNGCFTAHTATVLEKNCTASIQQGMKFNINPTIGETCSIPFNTDKKGNITIYSRGGKIVHREQNPSSNYVEWNGTDGYGALAEAGLYVYIIEYTDGTKVTGEVNIIR